MSAALQPAPRPMTYEDYMAEGEVNLRYDILDGVRMMTNPTRRHQGILRNVGLLVYAFEKALRQGRIVIAPCDVLIRRFPLRTRQPDLLFISNERWAQNPPEDDPAPVSPAPELVVEILSPSDTSSILTAKLQDYQSVGVLECWCIATQPPLIEVLRLTPTSRETVGVYGLGEVARSVVFPDLAVPVDAVFAP